MSMTTAPGRNAERTPSGPVRTSSTSGVSGSMVMTMEARRATSAGEAAAVAPNATSSSTGPRLRLCTTSVWPGFHQVFRHGLPHDAQADESNGFRHACLRRYNSVLRG